MENHIKKAITIIGLLICSSVEEVIAESHFRIENPGHIQQIGLMSASQVSGLIQAIGRDRLLQTLQRLDSDTLAAIFRALGPVKLAEITKQMVPQAPYSTLVHGVLEDPDVSTPSVDAPEGPFAENGSNADLAVIVVNPSNPLSDLTTRELKKVLTGDFTNWRDLGGPDLPIKVVLVRQNEAAINTLVKGVSASNAVKLAFLSGIIPMVAENRGAISLIQGPQSHQLRFIAGHGAIKRITIGNGLSDKETRISGSKSAKLTIVPTPIPDSEARSSLHDELR